MTDDELAIAVRDNGVGISAADIPHIFDLYRQVQVDETLGIATFFPPE